MNDAEFERQQARVMALADKWIGPLGLKWWDIRIRVERTEPEADEENWQSVMRVRVKWPYLQAHITVYAPAIESLDDESLERHFVHELCHIFVNEMRSTDGDDWLDHEERVVTQLANAFLWLRQHVERECRNANQTRATGRPDRAEVSQG